MTGKQVAIIGAGVSGLAAIKSCLEEELEPVCFEQFDNVGGLWCYSKQYRPEQGARAYDNLVSLFSKDMFAFSDFPFDNDDPPLLTKSTIYQYLQKYTQRFDLLKFIHFQTKVTKIRKSRDYDVSGKWEVTSEDSMGNMQMKNFDFVMICSGFFKNSRVPSVPGMDTFSGPVSHSKTFKNGLTYTGKRVLVVGNSHSAGDIAAEIARYADTVYLSVGSGTWILPRTVEHGYPLDQKIYRRRNFRSAHVLDKILMNIANSRLNHVTACVAPSLPPSQSRTLVSDDLQTQILCGKIKVVGRLLQICGNQTRFDNGITADDIDAIVFATGYQWNFSVVEEDITEGRQDLPFYKMTFPVGLRHPTLAVIGCMDPDGPIPPVTELQCRLAARVFTGNHELPPKTEMVSDIEKRSRFVQARYGRPKYKLPHLPFRDDLAQELGVTPTFLDLMKAGIQLSYQYYYGPAYSYYYRMWGPHTWAGARKAVETALKYGHRIKPLRQRSKVKHHYTVFTVFTLICSFLCFLIFLIC